MSEHHLDALDRDIINRLQDGFPICEHPYAAAAHALGIREAELLSRLKRLLDANTLTRFGPLYNVEQAGGALVLVAMSVPTTISSAWCRSSTRCRRSRTTISASIA